MEAATKVVISLGIAVSPQGVIVPNSLMKVMAAAKMRTLRKLKLKKKNVS